ncbi:MAG: DNA repair protein RecO [Clostridia bacterium]|nr:DNA repair protein RecO [Clostridia bacterium]
MALKAKGMIVKENNVGEADRFVTILTDEYGVIRASVRGARKVTSRKGASTRLLSFAQFSLVKGRDTYIVDTAVPERVFFATGGTVEQLALAQYFCELFAAVTPREDEASEYLKLLLNSLHLLEKGEQIDRIKAVAEWRLLSLAGYMPDLHTCRCGKGLGSPFFQPVSGILLCGACRDEGAIELTPAVLAAMRHVLYGDSAKCFSFRLSDEECIRFADAAERFVTCQLSRRFQTLEFYHSLRDVTI